MVMEENREVKGSMFGLGLLRVQFLSLGNHDRRWPLRGRGQYVRLWWHVPDEELSRVSMHYIPPVRPAARRTRVRAPE